VHWIAYSQRRSLRLKRRKGLRFVLALSARRILAKHFGQPVIYKCKTIKKPAIMMTQYLLFVMPRSETMVPAFSSRRAFWMLWLSVLLGLLCFPRMG
jgi:hypothetical protein